MMRNGVFIKKIGTGFFFSRKTDKERQFLLSGGWGVGKGAHETNFNFGPSTSVIEGPLKWLPFGYFVS